jgi:methyl-accepting chemotaxis protein
MRFIDALTSWGLFRGIAESIRNKFLVTSALLALVPLGILGIIAYRTAADALEQSALDHYASVAKARTDGLIAVHQKNARITEFAAKQKWLIDGLKQLRDNKGDGGAILAEMTARLKELKTTSPQFNTASVLDAKGQILAQTEEFVGAFANRDKSKDQYYTGAMAIPGKVFPKPIYLSATTGKIEQALSMTVVDPETAEIIGVFVFRLNVDGLQAVMADFTGMGQTGEAYIVNRDGLLVSQARLVKENTVLKLKDDSEVTRQALKAKATYQGFFTDYRGVPVLGTYTWLPDLNMVLVSKVDTAEAFGPVYALRKWTIGVVATAAVLVLVISFWLSGTLTRQVSHITNLFSQIGIGNFEARCEASSGDELGNMAVALNAMLDSILPLMQSRDERDRIQASIQKLLEEVSGVAEGDLTKQAEVTADVTGAIADSFNYMIEQLRDIISNVQDATLRVSSSASQIHTTAESLAEGTESQAGQIVNTSAAVDEMAVSIQQVSDNAAQSAKVAEQALANAEQGGEMVQNTIRGMNRIREQVQETAKRIKRLGESTQQIGEIVQLIDDIADRTSILALNASIQASMAGEAGRGFAVVAEEVERLAERSTNATKKIANLVKAIQSETSEAITAMEESTREVVEGSKLADQAGQSLGEIGSVSNRLAELIQSISLASKQQARASEGIAKSMGEISEVTQQTASGTKQAAVAVTNLASMADELRASVSRFKLPSANGHGNGDGGDRSGRQVPANAGGKRVNGHSRGKIAVH